MQRLILVSQSDEKYQFPSWAAYDASNLSAVVPNAWKRGKNLSNFSTSFCCSLITYFIYLPSLQSWPTFVLSHPPEPACLPADALTLKEVNSKATRTNVAPTQILIFSLSLLALEIFPFPFFISLKRVGSRESLCQRFLSSCLTFRLFMHAPHMSLGRAREIQLGCSAPLLAEILFSSRASSNV